MAEDLYIRQRQPPASSAKAHARGDAAWHVVAEDIEKYRGLFAAMERAYGDHLQLLRMVVDLVAQPADRRQAALNPLREDRALIARALLMRADGSPKVGEKMQIAVERYDTACRALQEADSLLGSSPALALAGLPKLRGKLYMLTTLHALFQGEPLLGRMFPPRSETSSLKETVMRATPGVGQTGVLATPARTGPLPRPVSGSDVRAPTSVAPSLRGLVEVVTTYLRTGEASPR